MTKQYLSKKKTYEADVSVPVPVSAAKARVYKYNFHNIPIGASILIPFEDDPEGNKFYSTARYHGVKITRRKTPDGWRVWRTQ